MDVGGPAHGPEIGQLTLVASIRPHRPDLRDQPVLRKAAPDNPGTIGKEERAAVVSRNIGEPPLLAPVRPHHVDLGEVRGIDLGETRFPLGKLALEHVPHRGEDDPLAVGRPASLGVVSLGVRETHRFSIKTPLDEDVHEGVVVPRVTAFLAALPERDLLLLQLDGTRIEMRRSEEDVAVLPRDEAAGCLPLPGGDPPHVAGLHGEQVDLEERIPRLPLRLEDHLLPVRREVPLAGTPPLDRQPPDPAQEPRLVLIPLPCGNGGREARTQSSKQSSKQSSRQSSREYEHEAAGNTPQRLEHKENGNCESAER